MNTENQTEELGTDYQWWNEFKARYALQTNTSPIGKQRNILVETWVSGRLPGLVDYINVSDIEPIIAVHRVIRFLLQS